MWLLKKSGAGIFPVNLSGAAKRAIKHRHIYCWPSCTGPVRKCNFAARWLFVSGVGHSSHTSHASSTDAPNNWCTQGHKSVSKQNSEQVKCRPNPSDLPMLSHVVVVKTLHWENRWPNTAFFLQLKEDLLFQKNKICFANFNGICFVVAKRGIFCFSTTFSTAQAFTCLMSLSIDALLLLDHLKKVPTSRTSEFCYIKRVYSNHPF